jgi:hypothetical protein
MSGRFIANRLVAVAAVLLGSSALTPGWGDEPLDPPQGTNSSPELNRPPEFPSTEPPIVPGPPGPTSGQLAFKRTFGTWQAASTDGNGQATVSPDAADGWVVRDLVVSVGGTPTLLSASFGVTSGGYGKADVYFIIEAHAGANFPDRDSRPPTASVDKLVGREFRLKSGDKVLARIVAEEFPANVHIEEPGTAWYVPGNEVAAVLDALRADQPITATAVVDDGELVFFDVRPRASAAAIDAIVRESQAQQKQINAGPKECFLTDACCALLGLGDDCFELATLRGYRDGYLARTVEGRQAIATYYVLAPQVLAGMRRRGAQRALARVYLLYILPCTVLARLGCNRITFRLYRRMMRNLSRQYAPETIGFGRVRGRRYTRIGIST